MGYFECMPTHYSQIVCAPTNRDGYGCNGFDDYENIMEVTSCFSDSYFDGIFTDIDPEEHDFVLVFNETMVAQANGMLAPIVRDETKFMTHAGSHTTQGFRQQYAIFVSNIQNSFLCF